MLSHCYIVIFDKDKEAKLNHVGTTMVTVEEVETHNDTRQLTPIPPFYNMFTCLPGPLSILTAIFRCGFGLAGTRISPFWILLELRMMRGGSEQWSYEDVQSSS